MAKVMRSLSLDELPQFVKILRGEMSLVDPRPIKQVELQNFYEPLDGATAYLSVLPGITELWQVSGRNATSYETRVSLDVAYAERMSIRTDLSILLRTFSVVIFCKGAY